MDDVGALTISELRCNVVQLSRMVDELRDELREYAEELQCEVPPACGHVDYVPCLQCQHYRAPDWCEACPYCCGCVGAGQ